MFKLFWLLTVIVGRGRSIDFLPCTEGVDANGMVLARRLLEEATPPGYLLTEIQPAVQTGRNPHRWVCRFERVDNVYRFDCPYLTEVRTAFRRFVPRGCEISQVVVNVSPNRQFITVEFMVNCGHTMIPRRRRSIWGFVREKSQCTGIPSRDQI